MRILVCGPGAEDARSPLWGHVLASLAARGCEAWGYDVEPARRNDRERDPAPVLDWLLDELRPELVIAAGAPVEVSLAATARGVRVHDLAIDELARRCHADPLRPGSPDRSLEEQPRSFDVVVAGAASPAAVTALIALKASGRTVFAWGDGWDKVADLPGATAGAVPYPLLGPLLRRGRFVLAVGPDGERQAREASAAGRPSLRGETVEEALRAAADGTKKTDDPGPTWDEYWDELLDTRAVTAPDSALVRDRVPRVSVLIPTYNNAAYVGASIESVLDQSYRDLELILLDDGSTDATPQVLDRYAGDPRVRVVRQTNVAQRDRFDLLHRRTGLLARGELLAALGSDDLCLPGRLAEQVAAFDRDAELDICLGAGTRIDPNGRPQGDLFGLTADFSQSTLLRALASANLFAAPTFLLRRDAYDRVGPFEEGFSSDYQFWLKAAGRLRFRYLPQRLVAYRIHPGGASTSSEGLPRSFAYGRAVLETELFRRGLADCYPELAAFAGSGRENWIAARAAAELDLGNRQLAWHPEGAVAAYGRSAVELGGPHPALLHNLAVAQVQLGDLERAAHLARRTGLPQSQPLVEALTATIEQGQPLANAVLTVFGCDVLSPSVAAALQRPAVDSLSWDGDPADVRRLLVVAPDDRPELLGLLLSVWCRQTSAGDRLCLMLPTLGRSGDALAALVLEQVERLGLDLDAAADIAISPIDSLEFLPPGYLSGAAILEQEGDVAEVARAISQLLPQGLPG